MEAAGKKKKKKNRRRRARLTDRDERVARRLVFFEELFHARLRCSHPSTLISTKS